MTSDAGGACVLCPADTTSPGGDYSTAVCAACPAGTASDANRTRCYPPTCPAGTSLSNGTCVPCAGNSVSSGGDALTAACSPCPALTVADTGKVACVAQDLRNVTLTDYAQITAGVVNAALPWGSIVGIGEITLTGGQRGLDGWAVAVRCPQPSHPSLGP